MRIESLGVISAGNSNITGDLVKSLEKGDVIRAKVLETAPGEVVLRLSDGSVLKAATVNEPGFRTGDVVLLSVRSKTESRIVLEIVSDPSAGGKAESGRLLKLLGSLGIEPDKTNLELASEFLKFRTRPSAEDMAKARELLNSRETMDPEKAAYIVSRKIDPSRFDSEMLARFLDGELKLGQLLESLAKALEQSAGMKSADDAADQVPVRANDPSGIPSANPANSTAHDPVHVPGAGTVEYTVTAAFSVGETQGMDETLPSQAPMFNDNDAAETGTPDNGAAAGQVTDLAQETVAGDNQVIPGKPGDAAAEGPTAAPPDAGDHSTRGAGNTPEQDAGVAARVPAGDTLDLQAAGNATGYEKEAGMEGGNSDAAPAERLEAQIGSIFARVSRKLSANDLDAGKVKEKVNMLLSEAENFIRTSRTALQDDRGNFPRTLALLGETVKTMDLMNSYQVLYYQVPVDLNGRPETAELYVMKRKRNRKRIDPDDTTFFLSVGTQNMGRIEALLDVKGKSISMDLRTESTDTGDFIRNYINGLYPAISECGYKLVKVSYSVIDEPAGPPGQEKLLLAMANHDHAKIDYRI